MDRPLSPHWADQTAFRLVKKHPDKESFTVASGITPSGVVHIGNFREVFTVDLVNRALKSLGKKVNFIYSWDDFDTFRKVPKNLPEQEMLATHLRRPISRVPDPFKQTTSYATHNIAEFEAELRIMGIKPEFQYQHQRYSEGLYATSIRHCLERLPQIKASLNRHRTEPLAEEWLPTSIYCEACDRDEMHFERYEGEWAYSYHCKSCDHQATIDIRQTKNLKLAWRLDWPMRWQFYQVDFEPGGKDHSSEGGSYDTAKDLIQILWEREAPSYLQYDFVQIKGGAGKMSSSSGNLFRVADALKVYDPAMVRWIFASQRPNHDFALAFDEDVIKTYEEFDRAEREAFGPPGAKTYDLCRRTIELSYLHPLPTTPPYRPPFRELVNRLQSCDGDIGRAKDRFYQGFLKTPEDLGSFQSRALAALSWLNLYAPENFRFRLNSKKIEVPSSPSSEAALAALRLLLENTDLEAIDAKDLNQKIYDEVIKKTSCEAKEFFSVVYKKLINRDQGPRLPPFLKEIGRERLLELL